MVGLILVACSALFIYGLVQWARSGTVLWDILQLQKNKQNKPAKTTIVTEKKSSEAPRTKKPFVSIRDLPSEESNRGDTDIEGVMDNLLRSSFKILGILALGVWVFVIASVIIDSLGLNWLDGVSSQANRFWGGNSSNPTRTNSTSSTRPGGGLQRRIDGLRRR